MDAGGGAIFIFMGRPITAAGSDQAQIRLSFILFRLGNLRIRSVPKLSALAAKRLAHGMIEYMTYPRCGASRPSRQRGTRPPLA